MKPLGDRERPGMARLDVKYQDINLNTLTDAIPTEGLRLSGAATGRNLLEWPLGKFRERKGNGEINASAPAGVVLQGKALAPPPRMRPDANPAEGRVRVDARAGARRRDCRARRAEQREDEFDRVPLRAPLAVGGQIRYEFGPEWITIAPGWVATRHTYVELEGKTAFPGERSRIPFHVTSSDWQESDRVLAGIMTAFGAQTRAVPIGGMGQFDGVMLGAFKRPRIEGTFTGDRITAFDVDWGHIEAQAVIENAYVDVTNGIITKGESRTDVEGRFALGYPRRDGGEEINGRIRMTNRPLVDLKHAFDLDEYRMSGVLSGEFHLTGKYQGPFGFGKMTIDRGVAYGESFETATSSLRFEGNGVRLDAINVKKGSGAHARRGVHRLGRPLCVQRRWRADSVGERGCGDLSRSAAVRRDHVLRVRQRHVRRAALRREGTHRRLLRRRRRHRPGERPVERARRHADDRSARSRLAASRGVRHRAASTWRTMRIRTRS